MKSLADMPIRQKLTLIIVGTSCVALLLAAVIFAALERVTFPRWLARNLSITDEMTAENTAALLTFEDVDAANRMLRSFGAHPSILGACIYDKNGDVFAMYSRSSGSRFVPPALEPPGYRFGDNHLRLFEPITLHDETIGTLYIESDLSELNTRFKRFGWAVAGVSFALSVFTFLLSTRVRRVITVPISRLSEVASEVARRKDYSLRVPEHRQDELGQLIRVFNEMLDQIQSRDRALQQAYEEMEKRVELRTQDLRQANANLQNEINERKEAEARLEKTHRELLEASRLAGMAEVATGVLHNVGNVLNSVNVSASIISSQVRQTKAANLSRAVALLKENQGRLDSFLATDPRGQHLIPYLETLARHLDGDREELSKELSGLQNNVEHIKDIVSMQQNYAKVFGVVEIVRVEDLVEDALRMNAGALTRLDISVVRDFGQVPPIPVERHKVLQILVNLIRNARYACDESGKPDRTITLRTRVEGDTVVLAVLDDGIGIPQENLTRIFNHGFTTRKDGHGFGLHSGALAAQQLGGSLSAQSEGPGKGAAFYLRLPLTLPSPESRGGPDSGHSLESSGQRGQGAPSA